MTPDLPRSVGFGPVFFPAQGSLGGRAVQTLPLPLDTAQRVVATQQALPEFMEDMALRPLLEVAMQGTAGAELVGSRFPLAASSQNVEDAVGDLPQFESRPPAPRRGVILGQERLHASPKPIRNTPTRTRWFTVHARILHERRCILSLHEFIRIYPITGSGISSKVIVVVAEANKPRSDRQILHATFRRSGRTDAEQGFDIDYYDMHWLPRSLAISNDGVWRSDLLGGGRVLGFVDRLKTFRTLAQYAEKQGWDYGEGFVEGANGVSRPATHIIGKPLLPSAAVTDAGINASAIIVAAKKPIEGPRSEKRFTPPMLLIREHMDLHRGVWRDYYLTYKNKLVGICADPSDSTKLQKIDVWLASQSKVLRAFVAAISVRLFTQKATTLSGIDILSIPYPEKGALDLSVCEKILADDIVAHYRDLIRLGEDSAAMKESGVAALGSFNETYIRQINAVYKKNKLKALDPQTWPGVICQPFVFGKGKIDWGGADELKGKLDKLLHEQRSSGLAITRIARLFDGSCIYLLKPDRLRYWLRSVALRDADETLADLWEQGF